MTLKLSITEARTQLTQLSRRLEGKPDTVMVTQHGRAVLAVLPWDLYDSILATMEVMGDPQLMDALRRSADDIARGRTLSHEEVGRRHGLA